MPPTWTLPIPCTLSKIITMTKIVYWISQYFKCTYWAHKNRIKSTSNTNQNSATLLTYRYILCMYANNISTRILQIKWKFLKVSQPFTPRISTCDICLKEKVASGKYAVDPSFFNKRSELAQACHHIAPFKLARLWWLLYWRYIIYQKYYLYSGTVNPFFFSLGSFFRIFAKNLYSRV